MDRAGERFASWQEGIAVRREAGLTLFFAPTAGGTDAERLPGRPARPDADAIRALAAESGKVVSFSISHQPKDHPYWVELLALGLTFDLRGLAPGIGAQVAAPGHAFGLPLADARGLECVVLRTGPHLASAGSLMPIVRTMAALGCELASLPGLVGIGWEPAGTIMAPDYFRTTAGAWLEGGAFPALGFTALARSPAGAMRSIGLGFFLGHELELAARPGESPADTARLAVRLIHDLVQNGSYSPGDHEGPTGDVLHCSFNADMSLLHIVR
ncbi:hypothetical protein ACFOD9_11335 [Novosphingobium bradum]|uniref:DUF4261 domain-containing protein n=1 Tax=Novosphingobium bradum TaxID=1737444 RepID=A0ABV7IS98_9SPHN